MKVVRLDLYDFKVVFTPDEGTEIIDIAKKDRVSVEELLQKIIEDGTETFFGMYENKE